MKQAINKAFRGWERKTERMKMRDSLNVIGVKKILSILTDHSTQLLRVGLRTWITCYKEFEKRDLKNQMKLLSLKVCLSKIIHNDLSWGFQTWNLWFKKTKRLDWIREKRMNVFLVIPFLGL